MATETQQAKANSLTILGADDITFANGQGSTMAGWRWVNGALVHRTGKALHFSPELTQEIEDAIARARQVSVEQKSGAEVSLLPASERDSWHFERTENDAIGIYVKVTAAVPSVVRFSKSDLQ